VSQRLDSWKEIAAHFGRRVRTVQRWEKDEGMPVHRHVHRRRGTVYAWSPELDAWWASRAGPFRGESGDEPAEALPGKGHAPAAMALGSGAGSRAAQGSPEGLVPRARRSIARGLLASCMIGLAVLASNLVARRSARSWAKEPPPVPDRVLEARYLLHRGSQPEVERAIALCSSEIEPASRPLRPADAAAVHECLAQGALERASFGRTPPAGDLRMAKAEAERALALDPRRSDALAIATRAGFNLDWDTTVAEAGYRRAISLAPAAALAHQGLARLLSALGRHGEAIAELRRAQRAEPLSAALNDDGCWFFYRARRYAEALVEAERALTLEPRRAGALQCIVDAQEARGEHAAARDAAVAILRELGDPAAEAVAAAPAAEAKRRLARRLLERLEEEREHHWVAASRFAMLYAQLGDRENALEWLERSLAERDPVLLLVRVHPVFDALRGDPRLEALLKRAGVGP
jgi:tetratricopeptide (TPR) repeat protein